MIEDADLVLPFADALTVILTHARELRLPEQQETVTLTSAQGRVLVAPLLADRDQPPFDRSTRDGYAVRAADISSPLRLLGSVRAGELWQGGALASGEAVEIMTGAPLPAGADAVLMLEHTELGATMVKALAGRALHPGTNVVPRAAEARTGAQLLPAGRVLHGAELAVAASCGAHELTVYAKPRIAVLATGDELVELDHEPAPQQIRNSNTYALAALIEAEGGLAQRLPIARDTLDDIGRRIDEGARTDLLLLSGGVSKGKFDLVERSLAQRGAEFFFTGALIQPGKPIVFGRLPREDGGWTYFFGLPGNPISTQVCFYLFVAPFLRALAGRRDLQSRFVEATLAEDIPGGANVTRFLPAELESAWDAVRVRVVGWQGSGDVAANARGNCYAVLPAGITRFAAGDTVRVLLR